MDQSPGDWGFDEWLTDRATSGWYWEKNYEKNGKRVELDHEVYCPDVAHDFAVDFIRRNRKRPSFLYYPIHPVHPPAVRTPDTAGEGKNLFSDNVAHIDKLVGKVVAEVDKLGLRENTILVFSGDNGTLVGRQTTIRGRRLAGSTGTMLEGGSRVPLIVNWKGRTPAGGVLDDLVDFSDLCPTFAEVGGVRMPAGVKIDGRSFAPQVRGEKGHPREWVYVQLGPDFFAKVRGWKLNQRGELFDRQQAPFEERPVPPETSSPAAQRARAPAKGARRVESARRNPR